MKLTEYAKSGGCAGKLGPRELASALENVPQQTLPAVLVGYRNSDDAGVFQVTDDLAMVQTVDFFSAVVDDPYTYGQIAATNALSDIYAMGASPKTALSIVAFPPKGMDLSVLGDIMRGGLDKLNEAGVALLGGHSVRDDEIKFGFAVTGLIHPADIKQNNGARSSDIVLITKALGAGLVTTALKRGLADPGDLDAAVQSMTRLNKSAAELAARHGASTMTDVTGFGLIGHASEVARASGISISIDSTRLPLLPGARRYASEGFCSGGLNSNRDFYSTLVDIDDGVPEDIRNILFDPQTSGGLLIFAPEAAAEPLLQDLLSAGLQAAIIGEAGELSKNLIHVR